MVRLHVLGFDKKCLTWLSLKNPNPPGIPLNGRLSNPPKTNVFPTEEDRFVLDTDASLFAIGGVLSQIQNEEEVVIA